MKHYIWIPLLLFSLPLLGQTYCLHGVVRNVQNQVPIVGAHVSHVGWSALAITDSLGRFELCGPDKAASVLSVSHLAYEPKHVGLSDGWTDNVEVSLDAKSYEFSELVVKGNSKTSPLQLPGYQTIDKAKVLSMPTLLGEADVVRALQQLPGIQSVSEGVNGIFVRGGSAGHNLVLFDNMELMNPVHLMGTYSVFNPLLTGSAEVYKGNSPVAMRGKIASSIVVSSVNPFSSESGFQASLGNITSNLTWVQKTADNKWAVSAGFRRSYLDLFRGVTSLFVSKDENYFNKYFYSFYDFNGRITYRPKVGTSLSMAWYSGADNFKIADEGVGYDATNNYGNRICVLEYKTSVGKSSAFSALVNCTNAWSRFGGDMIGSRVNFGSELLQLSGKLMGMTEKGNHLIRTGVDAYRYQTIPQNLFAVIGSDTIVRHNEFFNTDVSVFFEDTYKFSDKANVYAGVRSYLYSNYDASMDFLSVDNFGKATSRYYPLVPSLSFSYLPKPIVNYKLAYSYNVQMGHLASISSIPLPNDIWMMSSHRLAPERAHQLSLSCWRKLPFGSVTAEVYGKLLENQLIYNVNTDKNAVTDMEDHFFVGKGRAYGFEVSIDKTIGRLTGDLNYTLSRSKRSFPEIYGGTWFNDKFDRIHDLSLTGNFRLNSKWDFGANWIFASGNCMTLPAGRFWMMGTIMNDYTGFNTFRMPSYHRLDLSANLKLRSSRFKESILNFSIINVYNRSNPYFVFYKVYQGTSRYDLEIKAAQVSLFPIMPSINWRFKL